MQSRRGFLQGSIAAVLGLRNVEGHSLSNYSAAEVVAAIHAGRLTAESYAAALLQRLEACAKLNLTTWVAADKVLEAARGVDRARMRGEKLGPLAGLPVLVKDNIDTVGFPTSAGTAALKRYYPAQNAPLVQRLLDAGALVLAKTNMHELSSGATSSNACFGPVHNPYALGHIPGGSSGGTAAAIAAGAGIVGLGTDTAGSVRIPAAFCGIVGLRPSSGMAWMSVAQREGAAYEPAGVVPLALALDTIGPMGRTVEDVIVLDEAIRGRPVPRLSGLSGKRIGISPEQWRELDPEVERICKAAVERLERAGATIVEVDLSGVHEAALGLFWTLITAGNQHDLREFLSRHVPGVTLEELMAGVRSADVRYWFEKAADTKLPAVELDAARHGRRKDLVERYVETFSNHRLDAVVCPTEPVVAPPIRAAGDRSDDTLVVAGRTVSAPLTYIRNTAPSCALGAPGLSVPVAMGGAGLPVGLEFDGAPGRDAALLALGRAVESIIGRLPGPPVRGRRTTARE